MEGIKVYKKIDLVDPVMIAGWPGMGNVALGAVDYLRKTLKATKFAEIEMDPIMVLDAVEVENGLAKFPKPPKNDFYYVKKPDMIIFEGEAQLQGQAGINLLNKVLDAASTFNVKRIYTGAAFPLPISHNDHPELYGVANKDSLKGMLKNYGVKLMESGHISGLNGLALGFAGKKNIEAICLLATMPQYAIGLPNPKASHAIIDTLSRILNFQVDFRELNEYIKDMDERMSIIEEKVKDVFTIEEEEPEAPPAEKKIPAYIMEKIEQLFREAKKDKSKAMILKKELDRWDLYKLYEDRFLDLFKESQ